MDNLNKREAMKEWLKTNPGKQPEDWLLETRCIDNKQRLQVAQILRLCDEHHLIYEIPYNAGRSEFGYVWFDFAIHKAPIDLDAPDYLFENINPMRRWEKAQDFLHWKAEKELGEENKYAYDFLYSDSNGYFYEFFMDWREHAFLEGFAPTKTFDWSK